MTEFENKATELTPDELSGIGGGYRKPAEKAGFIIYQIRKGDTLTRIAERHDCSVAELLRWNPQITDRNRIYAGDYLYIRA